MVKKAAGNTGTSIIRDLAAAIIRDGKVPSDWEQSVTVCLYKGKGDALERGNYHGLKPTVQDMKVLERMVDSLIRQLVQRNNRRNLCVRQLQEKYLAANKRLHGFRRPGEGI